MTDYLTRAGDVFDIHYRMFSRSEQVQALSALSQAESLARIADTLEAQRVRPVIIQTNGKLTPEQAAATYEAVRDEH